jgi:hypothetical protein
MAVAPTHSGWTAEAPMPFDTETRYFNEHRAELLKHYAGKFVLIVGAEFVGAYDRQEDAYAAGVSKHGNVPLFIKRVEDEDQTVSLPAMTLGLIHARS